LVSIDSTTNDLVTVFNPSRTYLSKYAIRASNANGYLVDSLVDLVELRFDCEPSDYIYSSPSDLLTIATIVASPEQTI